MSLMNYILTKREIEKIKLNESRLQSGSNLTLNRVDRIWSDIQGIFYDTTYGRNQMFAISTVENGVIRSLDYGKTWEKVFQRDKSVNGEDHRVVYVEKGGRLLVWTKGGNLCRATPNFTQAETFTDMYTPLNTTVGIDEGPVGSNLIMFAEYGGAGGIDGKRIWKSTDSGGTWHVAHEDNTIGHWHSCQRDPYTGHWWICSGDAGSGAKIKRSTDDGLTWETMAEGSQEYRNCGLGFTENYVVWIPDNPSAGNNNSLFRISKESVELDWDTHRETVKTGISGASYGVFRAADGNLCFWTAAEGVEYSSVYLTNGIDAEIVFSTNRTPNTSTLLAGVNFMSKVDSENRTMMKIKAAHNIMEGLYIVNLPFLRKKL